MKLERDALDPGDSPLLEDVLIASLWISRALCRKVWVMARSLSLVFSWSFATTIRPSCWKSDSSQAGDQLLQPSWFFRLSSSRSRFSRAVRGHELEGMGGVQRNTVHPSCAATIAPRSGIPASAIEECRLEG